MARVTVEDCVVRVPNRFDLAILAAQRSRELTSGAPLTVERDNDKNPVVALREIADGTVSVDDLRDSVVKGHQRHLESDEPEEEVIELMAGEEEALSQHPGGIGPGGDDVSLDALRETGDDGSGPDAGLDGDPMAADGDGDDLDLSNDDGIGQGGIGEEGLGEEGADDVDLDTEGADDDGFDNDALSADALDGDDEDPDLDNEDPASDDPLSA